MDTILSSGGSNASGDSIGGVSSSSNGGNGNSKSQRFGDSTQNNGVNAEVKKIYQ